VRDVAFKDCGFWHPENFYTPEDGLSFMEAILVCGGVGERMRPLTDTLPKPMIPIDGKPVLEYLVMLCKKHGFTRIAITTSYLPEVITDYFGDGSRFGVEIVYSFEPELLGTAGALNNFKGFFTGPFAVIYGDQITDIDLTKMLEFHKAKGGLGTIYMYKEDVVDEKTTPSCVVTDGKDEVLEIIERPTKEQALMLAELPPECKTMKSGIYILEPSVIDLIPEGKSDFSMDTLPAALKIGKLYAYFENCYIKEVGQMMRYLIAKEDIESGRVKLGLWD